MQATLPYDIWHYIASLLPPPLLLKLYSVHPAFLHHVLRIRYGSVTVSTLKSIRTQKSCTKYVNSTVAKHVRTLFLCPDSQMDSSHRKTINSIAGTARKVICQIDVLTTPFTIAAAQGRLLEQITSMTNIDSLVVCRGRHPREQHLEKIDLSTTFGIHALLAHSSNLQSLSLSTPYIDILCDAPTISGLKAFKVTLHEDINPDVYSTLISFITRHSQMLNSIAVAICDVELDPSYLFSRLPRLRHLTEVFITLPFDRMESEKATHIDVYLRNHRHSLQKLKYHFCSAPPREYTSIRFSSILQKIFTSPILRVEFPQMTSLDIQFLDWDSRVNTIEFSRTLVSALASYLKQILRRTLISFKLDLYFLPACQYDPHDLFSALENEPLRYLHIQTCDLTGHTLDRVYTYLPQLYELVWTVGGLWTDSFIIGRDLPYPRPHSHVYYLLLDKYAERLAKELSKLKRKFDGWALRHLTIRHIQSWRGREERIESLLEATLPPSISFSIVHVPMP